MDMQGTPIGSTSQGMKNTTDPSAKETIVESAGAVASDSLAAESTRAGGGFSSNKNSEPLGVKGANSTLANTETSGATTLPPAPSATKRDELWNESGAGSKYPEGLDGQSGRGEGYDTRANQSGGAFSGDGIDTGDSRKVKSTGLEDGQTSAKDASASIDNSNIPTDATSSTSTTSSKIPAGSSKVDTAPNYVTSVTQPFGQGKPKGKNITEGGFDELASSNAEIGSDLDPGRKAEADFQKQAQGTFGVSGPKEGMQDGGNGQYDALRQ